MPKLPGLDGIDEFEGHSFHTSRWDYEYTGGDPSGALMSKLRDKKVGIIGAGVAGLQHLLEAAQRYHGDDSSNQAQGAGMAAQLDPPAKRQCVEPSSMPSAPQMPA